MRNAIPLLTLCCLILAAPLTQTTGQASELGFSPNTIILESETGRDCPDGEYLTNDDGSFENAYAWTYGGTIEPDYGAWAEGYPQGFVCSIVFGFTQTGLMWQRAMDAYIWEFDTGNPGNVLCMIPDVALSPAFWPTISLHEVIVNCYTEDRHFAGFWGIWPYEGAGWYLAADENGLGLGNPRTNISPLLTEYPEGWHHPNVVTSFENCEDLGIHEWLIPWVSPTPTSQVTWGSIKTLYR